jgi:hypothetical protein
MWGQDFFCNIPQIMYSCFNNACGVFPQLSSIFLQKKGAGKKTW